MMKAEGNAMRNGELRDLVERLIDANIDSQIGFQVGSEYAADSDLRLHFQALASERYAQTLELKYVIRALGERAGHDSSWPGDLHSDRFQVRAASVHGDRAMLESAQNGEARIREVYEVSLRKCTSEEVSDMLRQHLKAIKTVQGHLADLRAHYEEKIGWGISHQRDA